MAHVHMAAEVTVSAGIALRSFSQPQWHCDSLGFKRVARGKAVSWGKAEITELECEVCHLGHVFPQLV